MSTIEPDLRLYTVDETRFWREDIAAAAGKIRAVYLFDAARPVNCCEITPSYEMHRVGSNWSRSPQTDEGHEALADLIHAGESDTDAVSYFHVRSVDLSQTRARPYPNEMTTWQDLLDEHDGNEDDAHNDLIESTLDYCRANGFVD